MAASACSAPGQSLERVLLLGRPSRLSEDMSIILNRAHPIVPAMGCLRHCSTTQATSPSLPSYCVKIVDGTKPAAARDRHTVINYQDLARSDKGRFRGGLDDVIIIPLVAVALVLNRILQFTLSLLIRVLDYAFPFAVQIIWLPLFAAKLLGSALVVVTISAFRFLPLSEEKLRQWRRSIRRRWAWFRRRISYRVFEQTVHDAFEGGMAWVFQKCRHLTPNAALLVILGAVLWLPVSFAVATVMHAVLIANVAAWPAWTQLLHPLATVIAKSKLLVVPVYPAAWPQAKRHPFVQLLFRVARAVQRVNLVKKISFRYQQAEIASSAAVERLERTAGFASTVSWLRKTHGAENLRLEQRTRKLRSLFSRWSIKFSAQYYEAKERDATSASAKSNNATNISDRTPHRGAR